MAMLNLFIDWLPEILFLVLSFLIGWTLGTARLHWPIIRCFRNYYQGWARERIAQHTRFLISFSNLYGAIALSHRSAVAGAEQHSGGLGRSRVISLRAFRARTRLNLKKGGDNNKLETVRELN
jgi:hypothetical protein